MSQPVIVIRPQPGCDATVAQARARGLDAHGYPLFAVAPLAWEAPAPDSFDALLIGSANPLRHGGAALEAYRGKPAYAVGETTAAAARAAGLDVVATGSGGLQALLAALAPEHRRLLRLAGEARVHLVAPPGVTITERTVYASSPAAPPPGLLDRLRQPAVVLVHSAEAARHLAALCEAEGIARGQLALAALGPRVSAAAGTGWAVVADAERPCDAALLALADELCHARGQSQETARKDTLGSSMQAQLPQQPAPLPARRRSARGTVLVGALAFLAGGALVGAYALREDLARLELPWAPASEAPAVPPAPALAPPAVAGRAGKLPSDPVSTLEARLAMLEDRLSRADAEARAAAGNASRAEALLVAVAARRMVERGDALGTLENQLKLRFGDGQPLAVDAIVTFAKTPVTRDDLLARLDALEPGLTGVPAQDSVWSRFGRRLSGLFVLHRDAPRADGVRRRFERARLMLVSGKTDQAIAEVEALPGGEDAVAWIADANRYAAVQRALDLVEVAALLGPRGGAGDVAPAGAGAAVPPAVATAAP